MGLSAPGVHAPLAAYLRERTGASAVQVLRLARLGGGAIQENYALDVRCEGGTHAGELALVLRSDAPSGVSVSLPRSAEFAVLQVAFAAGVTVPEPLWCCREDAPLGRPFFIMRRAPGTAVARTLIKAADAGLIGDPLVRQLGAELARLHALQPPQPALGFLALPQGAPAAARVALYRALLDDLAAAQPLLEWALAWLDGNAPPPGGLALCHCDFRTGNLLVDGSTLTAILDWEFAAWSDPLEDLGWVCARCWRFGAWQREVGGLGSRDALYRGYAQVSGSAPPDRAVRYWEIMAAVRWAIIALHQAERHLGGGEPSLELALTGRMVPEMALDIVQGIESYERAATATG